MESIVGNVFDPGCPTRKVLDRVGDRWTVLVVSTLLDAGTCRFTELRNRIGGVTPKVLTQTLRGLERDGLVTRTVYAQVPPRVDYRLTPLGQGLDKLIAAIRDWAEDHIGEVVAAQHEYDAATSAT